MEKKQDHRSPTYIPASSWPYDRDGAPGQLELVRRFCNTRNPENGADRFETVRGVLDWLDEQERPRFRLTAAELADVVEFRQALRELIAGPPLTPRFRTAASAIALAVEVGDDGALRIVAPRGGFDRLRAELIDIVITAQREGAWRRLKMCDNCHWTFYDHSKNSSGRWCTMQACGQRLKAKAYRQRVRQRAEAR